MIRWLVSRINLWVILAALLTAGALILFLGVLISMLPRLPQANNKPAALLTVIPAPTATNTSAAPSPTPTGTPPVTVDGISVGVYVQISGTEGQGLRLRSGPGTTHQPRFLGMDAEVFLVKDGPQDGDNFTWWYLEAPYDPGRSGWAASSYLTVINQPVPTPTP